MKSSAEDGSESAMLSRVLVGILVASSREPTAHPFIFSELRELVVSEAASSRWFDSNRVSDFEEPELMVYSLFLSG